MQTFVERRSYLEDGPVALVVGVGDMGLAVARMLGADRALTLVDADAERLDQALETLRQEGFSASGVRCDIVNPDDIARLTEILVSGSGVRTLAHVAGIGAAAGDWRKVIDVNLIGAHRVAAAVGPRLVRGGAAIFVASIAASLVQPMTGLEPVLDRPLAPDFVEDLLDVLGSEPDPQTSYNLSKRGVTQLARSLAVRWGEREVRAMSLSPGMIDTTMGRASGQRLPSADGTKTVDRSERVREVPLGRQGSIQEIARTLAFLASDGASYINGVDLLVDGGLSSAWRYAEN